MILSDPVVSKPERRPDLNGFSGNRLLARLSEVAFNFLEPNLRQLTLVQGTVCYGVGDPIDQVYFPHNGMISQLVTTGKCSGCGARQ
jgi:hypothetical protein